MWDQMKLRPGQWQDLNYSASDGAGVQPVSGRPCLACARKALFDLWTSQKTMQRANRHEVNEKDGER